MSAKIVAMAAARGHMIPEGLVRDIWPLSRPYWDGWWILSASRPWISSMGGAVPLGLAYHDIREYARDHGARSRVAVDDWVTVLRAMDGVYLERQTPAK